MLIREAGQTVDPGNYTCSQCGKYIRHDGGKLKRCDNCKSPRIFYTGDEKSDTSYKWQDWEGKD